MIARHVDAEAGGAHHGALKLALGQQFGGLNLDALAHRNHSDYRRRAALPDGFEALPCQFGDPDRFK